MYLLDFEIKRIQCVWNTLHILNAVCYKYIESYPMALFLHFLILQFTLFCENIDKGAGKHESLVHNLNNR